LAADAQNENMSLKEKLETLKRKLKEEQDLKLKAYAEADKREGVLCESIESLRSKISLLRLPSSFNIFIMMTYISH
jgi:hypothetical protein